MRKNALALTMSIAMAGCDSTTYNLLSPMEPTQASIDAPRRQLTDAEKDLISDAVKLKSKDFDYGIFDWPPLIVRLHDHVIDYCGIVQPSGTEAREHVFYSYYAKLHVDSRGKIANVNVESLVQTKNGKVPTDADSICAQDGYKVLR